MDSVSEVSCEIFSTFCGLFLLLNNAMYGRDFGRFSRYIGEQVSVIFSSHRFFYEVLDIFPRLSYRLTFIKLNVEMVDNLEFW